MADAMTKLQRTFFIALLSGLQMSYVAVGAQLTVKATNKLPLARAGQTLFPNAERTLKGPGEMLRLWSDAPEVVGRSLEIAAEYVTDGAGRPATLHPRRSRRDRLIKQAKR